eukprot:253113-Rhodomonas_salina.2
MRSQTQTTARLEQIVLKTWFRFSPFAADWDEECSLSEKGGGKAGSGSRLGRWGRGAKEEGQGQTGHLKRRREEGVRGRRGAMSRA